MKSLCLIRFGNEIDPHVSYILGMLSAEPITHCIKTNGTVITPFKSEISIKKCKKILAKYNHNFILVDVTNNNDCVQVFGDDTFTTCFLGTSPAALVVTDEDREKDIFFKIRTLGIGTLTPEEHAFMQSRMKA